MIIECPNCNKKFDIDQNLISENGRLLQCGSCDHKWFFKLNIDEKINEKIESIDNNKNANDNFEIKENEFKKNINTSNEEITLSKKKIKKNINYLSILIVIILSIVAFVLIIDTFKNQLTSIIPNIKFLLNNLYQSIEDIKLFLLDLIN